MLAGRIREAPAPSLARSVARTPRKVLINQKVSFDIEHEYYLIINSAGGARRSAAMRDAASGRRWILQRVSNEHQRCLSCSKATAAKGREIEKTNVLWLLK